jgi:hypothetical protein
MKFNKLERGMYMKKDNVDIGKKYKLVYPKSGDVAVKVLHIDNLGDCTIEFENGKRALYSCGWLEELEGSTVDNKLRPDHGHIYVEYVNKERPDHGVSTSGFNNYEDFGEWMVRSYSKIIIVDIYEGTLRKR